MRPSTVDPMIAAARAGSTEALDRLIALLSDHLRQAVVSRYDARTLGPSRSLSDLVQDTLLRVREKFPQFQSDTYVELQQWAAAILRHRWQEWRRNRLNRNSDRHRLKIWQVLLGRNEHSQMGEDARAMQREDAERAHALYKKLRPNEQFIIELRLFSDLSYKEIALVSDWTPNAARMAYDRAIERLKELFYSNGNSPS
ncbi:MAG: RNA polymerase sigma factor [Planctomycetota bacterium]